MTALFVIIFIDNWEKTKNHVPAVLGLIISMLCLIIAGARSFMLPSLILVSGVLLLMREKKGTVMKIEFFFGCGSVGGDYIFFACIAVSCISWGTQNAGKTDLSWKNPAISNYGCADCVLFKGNRE